MGHRRADLTDLPVLFWPVERYPIIYRAVTQWSRDIPALVQRRFPSWKAEAAIPPVLNSKFPE